MDLLQITNTDSLPEIRVVATPAGRKSAQPIQFNLSQEKKEILKKVRQSMIGEDITFLTPFGLKKVVYADFTASGRLSTFVESFMQSNVRIDLLRCTLCTLTLTRIRAGALFRQRFTGKRHGL